MDLLVERVGGGGGGLYDLLRVGLTVWLVGRWLKT